MPFDKPCIISNTEYKSFTGSWRNSLKGISDGDCAGRREELSALKREKRNKWRDARDRLLKLAAEYPEKLARDEVLSKLPKYRLRKLDGGLVPPDLSPLAPKELDPTEFEKIIRLLSTIARPDPVAYSLVLQSFLASFGLFWPDGVFKHDFAVPDRGRSLSTLSILAWVHYVPNSKGWRQVAKRLIPEEFEANAEEAASKVRKAVHSYLLFRESVMNGIFPAEKEELDRLLDLVGARGLYALASRVDDIKFREAMCTGKGRAGRRYV